MRRRLQPAFAFVVASAAFGCGQILSFDDSALPPRSPFDGGADGPAEDAPAPGATFDAGAPEGVGDAGGGGGTEPAPHRIFVTGATWTGDLGGSAGADAKCQAVATAAGLTPGTFGALLTETSRSDIPGLTPGVAFARLDGQIVFASTPTTVAASPRVPIVVTDDGGALPNDFQDAVWSGFSSSPNPTCRGWTTAESLQFGGFVAPYDSAHWLDSEGKSAACSAPYHLYCVER